MNTKEISKYVINNYPKSCFYWNYKDKNIDLIDELQLINDLKDFFEYEVLKFCGCGGPDEVLILVRDILVYYKLDDFLKESKKTRMILDIQRAIFRTLKLNTENETHECIFLYIMYMLNDSGLLEHGSSVYSSWITELGEMFIHIIDRYIDELYID